MPEKRGFRGARQIWQGSGEREQQRWDLLDGSRNARASSHRRTSDDLSQAR